VQQLGTELQQLKTELQQLQEAVSRRSLELALEVCVGGCVCVRVWQQLRDYFMFVRMFACLYVCMYVCMYVSM